MNGKERFVLKVNGKARCVLNVKERSAQPCKNESFKIAFTDRISQIGLGLHAIVFMKARQN
jgi:hypothetical protein